MSEDDGAGAKLYVYEVLFDHGGEALIVARSLARLEAIAKTLSATLNGGPYLVTKVRRLGEAHL